MNRIEKYYSFLLFYSACRFFRHGKWRKSIVMVSSEANAYKEIASLPLMQHQIFPRFERDFRGKADKAYFYYSLDRETGMR